ncbi:S8 family peptidase [Gottfriedia luciferensis]|uniref:S8 family peptidase n=1 Tax=Gottfriedia luciferensis TaxID=178774 RepID=UPI000B44EFFB|nr:S8 family peptidase [Gottfriedia luciferensis]
MSKFRLIPYKLEEVKGRTKEVPPGVRLIEAKSIWEKGFQGEDVVVAVIDTGCQTDHPDLQERIIGGYNFTEDYGGDPNVFLDNNGHGTHVCGTIGASKDGQGVVGVAPKVKLLVLKVLSGAGEGSIESITQAIEYAINWKGANGETVRVISMSLGGPEDDQTLHKVIQSAVENNIVVVCAAGNEGDGNGSTSEYSYPGAYNEVVEVGSVNLHKRLSRFSNTNNTIDLVAPGEKILSTYPTNQYAVLSGTSMATPHVSGAIALLIQQYETENKKKISESELYELLINHTVSLGYSTQEEGHGLLQLGVNVPAKSSM